MTLRPFHGPKDQTLCTPPELYRGLCHFFQIDPDLDVAASTDNSLCERFFSERDDGLTRSWNCRAFWCNPPFKLAERFVEKARTEYRRAPLAGMMLLPSRTDTRWFASALRDPTISLLFLTGRVRYLRGGEPLKAPFEGSVVLAWGKADRAVTSRSVQQITDLGKLAVACED